MNEELRVKLSNLSALSNIHILLSNASFKGEDAQNVLLALSFVTAFHDALKAQIDEEEAKCI